MKARLLIAASAVALPLALGACKGDSRKDAGAGTAQGEVLPGSASDAMLPLDTVKSQAPLAPKSEGGAGSDKAGGKDKPGSKADKTAKEPAADATAAASPPAAASSTAN